MKEGGGTQRRRQFVSNLNLILIASATYSLLFCMDMSIHTKPIFSRTYSKNLFTLYVTWHACHATPVLDQLHNSSFHAS